MTRIVGDLASVNSVPTEGTVLLRALELRPGVRFAVTGEPKIAVIKGGHFAIDDVEPGPVQLTIQGNGATHDVRVDVPDVGEVSLLELLDNVYDWEPAQISAVKLAAREAREAADEAGRVANAFRGAEQLEGWASSASESASNALGSERAAAASASAAAASERGSAASEVSAAGSAAAAKASEGAADASKAEAAGSAKAAADSAREGAEKTAAAVTAAESASGSAKRDADRAGQSAVAARASEEAAETSASFAEFHAATAREAADDAYHIAGGDFAPRSHKHLMKDITDLPEVTSHAVALTVPVREADTMIRVDGHKSPQFPGHLTHKRYVDGLVAEVQALMESRPALFSGRGPAPDTLPGAVVGDFYFDEEAKELHKITEV